MTILLFYFLEENGQELLFFWRRKMTMEENGILFLEENGPTQKYILKIPIEFFYICTENLYKNNLKNK
jgi:hypothetical protein